MIHKGIDLENSDIKLNSNDEGIDKLDGQFCPVCHTKSLILIEKKMDIPFFGPTFLFAMTCSKCDYYKGDLESEEKKEPAKYVLEVECEEDLKIRVIRSSEGTVKLPRIASISPGPSAEGYVTNVEGIFNRIKEIIEKVRDNAEDSKARKKAKNMLKKIQKIMWGQEKIKLTLEDPTGNSAIISDKAVKSKL